jgi:phage-related protein
VSTFSYTADFGAVRSSKPAVTQVKFGDGYEARQQFGINQNLKQWQLTFKNRSDTDANAIETFLDARAGTESFDWTPPNGSSAKWICREWSRALDNYNYNTIQATFEQLMEP